MGLGDNNDYSPLLSNIQLRTLTASLCNLAGKVNNYVELCTNYSNLLAAKCHSVLRIVKGLNHRIINKHYGELIAAQRCLNE